MDCERERERVRDGERKTERDNEKENDMSLDKERECGLEDYSLGYFRLRQLRRGKQLFDVYKTV